MCVSIVFGIKVDDHNICSMERKIKKLGAKYEYGIEHGIEKLEEESQEQIARLFNNYNVIFEVHDLSEPHCACDIEEDIRNGAKLGQPSKYFDFVKETIEAEKVLMMAVLFYQDVKPDVNNVRHNIGNYNEFVKLINTWHTWQVEGFEPNRQAYEIADDSPLIFTFKTREYTQ